MNSYKKNIVTDKILLDKIKKQKKKMDKARKDDDEFYTMLKDLEHLYFEEKDGKYTFIYNNKIVEISEEEYIEHKDTFMFKITNDECEDEYMEDFDE